MIQSMVKHMVERVEMNVVMLMAGIKKRAYVGEFVRSVDGELSDLRRETVSELQARPRQVLHVGSLCSRSALQVSAATVCTTQLEHREYDNSH